VSLLVLVSLLGQTPVHEPQAALLVPAPAEDRKNAFDLMVASPLGLTLRFQRRWSEAPLYVEGYLGTWALGAGAGVGLRTEFANDLSPCNLFLIRPGVDFYYMAFSELVSSSSSAGALVFDVDLAWQHRYAGGTIGELGLKIGPGFAVTHDNIDFFPVIGLYHGWRF